MQCIEYDFYFGFTNMFLWTHVSSPRELTSIIRDNV